MSTQISLTEGLKLTALQQYHPRIDIELWSLEQEEYENNNYYIVNQRGRISKEEIYDSLQMNKSIPSNSETFVQISFVRPCTIYPDNIYPSKQDDVILLTDNIPNQMYWFFLEKKSYNITIGYFLNEEDDATHPFWESTLTITAEKNYQKQTISSDKLFEVYDCADIEVTDVKKMIITVPEGAYYIGEKDDGIILNQVSTEHNTINMQLPESLIPDNICFSSSIKRTLQIIINLYYYNSEQHSGETEAPGGYISGNTNEENQNTNEATLAGTGTIRIDIIDDADRINLPIAQNENVNLKIIERDIYNLLAKTAQTEYSTYIGKEYNNIVFTPKNDSQTIIPYEYYNGVFYLKMPRFYKIISMHLLSKFFDAEDNVVLLNESDIKELISNQTWIHGTKIDRGTDKINIVDNSCSSNCYGRYMIPLPSSIKSLESLEIDIFSKYPTNSHKSHQVGLIDTDNRTFTSTETADKYEYQKTLAYSKKESSDSSLQIITIKRNQEDITTDNAFSYDTINQKLKMTNAFNKDYKYETIIKYHNDNLYIEEYNPRAANASPNRKQELQTDNKYNYMTQTWQEEDE